MDVKQVREELSRMAKSDSPRRKKLPQDVVDTIMDFFGKVPQVVLANKLGIGIGLMKRTYMEEKERRDAKQRG